MPELPEVETVRRGLQASLPGERIVAVHVLRALSISYPSAKEFPRRLAGHKIEQVRRRGKYLLLDLDRQAGLAIHLRMSGRCLIVPKEQELGRHVRVRILLESGLELRFEDMRVFGRLWYKPAERTFEQVIPSLSELGPEPLDKLTADYLMTSLKNKTQSIKAALLDQRVVAGLGNIYVDESLHKARIHPQRSAGDCTATELVGLVGQIKSVLSSAIAHGGTTLRDYTDSRGVNGNYQNESCVYGRAGQDCRSCGRAIKRVRIAGRSTHFCPRCQPERKRR